MLFMRSLPASGTPQVPSVLLHRRSSCVAFLLSSLFASSCLVAICLHTDNVMGAGMLAMTHCATEGSETICACGMIDGSVVVLHLPSLVEIARFETDGSHSGECSAHDCACLSNNVLIPLTPLCVCTCACVHLLLCMCACVLLCALVHACTYVCARDRVRVRVSMCGRARVGARVGEKQSWRWPFQSRRW